MNLNNDYIVAIDENGEAYIAHAIKMSRKPAFGHKSPLYLDKVQLENGKYRYFYTRKAYETWLKNQKPSTKEQKEMADKKKRMQIYNLRKSYGAVAKKLGYKSKEAQGLLKEIRELEKDYYS